MVAKITRDQLKAKLDAGENIILVEALPEKYYADKHLPGAINLPHTQVAELASTHLPDKSAEIVVYCANGACQNSTLAANQLVELGYSNVRGYEEGKQDWMEAGLPTESSNPVLI